MECHEFDIEVRPDGDVRVHVRGAKGHACMDYVKLLETILGSKATEVQHTSEFYEASTGVQIRVDQQVRR